MPYSQRFGELVKQQLGEDGRPYRDLAPLIGVHYGTLYDWVKGNAPQSLEKVMALIDVLGVPPNPAQELLQAARPGAATSPQAALRIAANRSEELRYDPELEDIDVAGFRGLENLPPATLAKVNRVVRALLSEEKRSE